MAGNKKTAEFGTNLEPEEEKRDKFNESFRSQTSSHKDAVVKLNTSREAQKRLKQARELSQEKQRMSQT